MGVGTLMLWDCVGVCGSVWDCMGGCETFFGGGGGWKCVGLREVVWDRVR